MSVREHSGRLRRIGYRGRVEHLAGTFGLRRRLDLDTATDLLLLYGGGAIYRTLVVDYGRTEERFTKWLTDTLTSQLLR